MSAEAISLAGVPVIRTERLVLRGLEARDLAPYVAYRTGPRNARPGGPMDPGEAAEKFAAMAGHWVAHGFGQFVICEAGDAPGIGHVGPSFHGDCDPPQMTWTLWSAEHEGRAYAVEAARAVLARPGPWAEFPAFVRPGNARSHRVAERLGGVIVDGAPPPPWMPDALTYRLPVAA